MSSRALYLFHRPFKRHAPGDMLIAAEVNGSWQGQSTVDSEQQNGESRTDIATTPPHVARCDHDLRSMSPDAARPLDMLHLQWAASPKEHEWPICHVQGEPGSLRRAGCLCAICTPFNAVPVGPAISNATRDPRVPEATWQPFLAH